MEKLKKSKA